jgi:hypothetical protein
MKLILRKKIKTQKNYEHSFKIKDFVWFYIPWKISKKLQKLDRTILNHKNNIEQQCKNSENKLKESKTNS